MRNLTCLFLIAFLPVALAAERRIERDGVKYSTCTFLPNEVELYWLSDSGAPLRQFSAVQNFLARRSKKVRFLRMAASLKRAECPLASW